MLLDIITKARIETLVGQGKSFAEAKWQAEGEFQDFLGVTEHFNQGFEQMSIASEGDFNAMLLVAEFVYPDKATPTPELGGAGAVSNILVKDVTHFDGEQARWSFQGWFCNYSVLRRFRHPDLHQANHLDRRLDAKINTKTRSTTSSQWG